MIALYSRVSTAEQANEGYSIAEQQERLTNYCRANGWKGYKHFTDAGYSGGNMNRPAMQDMIKGINAGTIDRVIVYKLDRLSRSQKDTILLLEDIFLPHGVDFISMSENFDTGSPFGKATIGLFSVFAQLERDTIRERVTLGRAARAKDGKYHGGSTPPVGYDYKDGGLVINEFEAMQVRECFRLYESGFTYTEIADELNRKGWTHKNGIWLLQRVHHVLTNTVYIGKVKFGGVEHDGIHEPIIDEKTFDAVGAMIAKKKTSCTHKRRPIDEAYLVGKIYCARCGRRYTHTSSISGHNRNGRKISYYSCYARLHHKRTTYKCDNKIHRAADIDKIVFDHLRELCLGDVVEHRQKAEPDVAHALQGEIEKIDRQRSRLIDLFALGTFDAEELTAKIEPLNATKAELQKQLDAIAYNRRPIADVKNVIDSIGGVLDAGNPVQIRNLIDLLIDRIEIDGDDISIRWDF